FVVDATQNGHAGSRKCRGERPRCNFISARIENKGACGIYIQRFRLVQREHVNKIKLKHRIRVELVRISNIPLLGVWIAVSWIHDATSRTGRQLSWRGGKVWRGIDA